MNPTIGKAFLSLQRSFIVLAVTVVSCASLALPVYSQKLSSADRNRAKDMLRTVRDEIKDKYFDPKFKGVDLDSVFNAANEKIESATSLGQAFGIIAQAVMSLDDSHTVFYPPDRTLRAEYGWRMQMIGDKCFVTAVKPKSDAETKGLKVGDEILTIEGAKPTRKDLWKINYYYNFISIRAGLSLSVKAPGATEARKLDIAAKMEREFQVIGVNDYNRDIERDSERQIENRFARVGNTMAWNMPTFSVDPAIVEGIMNGRSGQSQNLIIDLRGNGGGYVVTLEALAGFFVDEDTKIADYKARKEMKPQMAKSKGKGVYRGRLVVLVDSQSGSASEIFARFIQINGKGVVLGDQSAGAVMMSRGEGLQWGTERLTLYGMNLTRADVIMTDGKSLEHVGVTPNFYLRPTGLALSRSEDPVLSEAFKLFGEDVTPEQAGKFFPFEWKYEK
ncbi:MAG TPA: S41 family peptidase [Pyrinomonadaceae bacterium]|nr:S41 family peptidase [Pyrinomonadaceae bacterium]